jgi:localization factor PodJL
LRDEVESLGQRLDDLTVKAASEHDLSSLRIAIEKVSARIAQGPDLKPLADLDRRLTEMTNKLEHRLANHVGGQIGAADLDKRIATAVRQNQIPPPWTVIERKLTGISDRLANTEMELQHIATHEKWILQLYKGLEEALDWSRNVAEDAASRMANHLVQEWSRSADPAKTSAAAEAVSAMSASPASTFSGRAFERSASSRTSLSAPWTAEPRTIAGALSSPPGRAR